jgi:hypothetical protein
MSPMTKGDPRYGAPMGRPSLIPSKEVVEVSATARATRGADVLGIEPRLAPYQRLASYLESIKALFLLIF